ncbi:hypothetical protein BDN72DRAFT_819685 [Pluteus cervinus]|uniref:Uncharacterized protein n=1 Tax=Pluteus cervinus TaxID=181527 RepID=A0ACD3AW30_9AGAR|nr:hypothetical protein BDN72DRAFT_819685 [Pluteus cervinus]
MGVPNLWRYLLPAQKTRSLTELAVSEGFEDNKNGLRGFRIGIDASIWLFHAEYGREGENPELRTIFFRCATLMNAPFLPLFVFDGPKRPHVKRGKEIKRLPHKLVPGVKAIVEAFGYEWRTAPGEAEAELASLNHLGIIDGILSDDVDTFLFGATTVIRNSSNNLSGNKSNPALNAAGKDDKNHAHTFRMEDITKHSDIQLTRGGLILFALLSGGDYDQSGLSGCGHRTAYGIARCGFGDTLFEAALTLDRAALSDFLVNWRNQLRHELRTNSQGLLKTKQGTLANRLPESFPDIDILLSYTNPITSVSLGRADDFDKITWSKDPDIGKLAAVCEFYFEWGYEESIIKRFRTVIWHGAVLRILRRAALDKDTKFVQSSAPLLSTPRKASNFRAAAIGTPSKLIAKHFSSMSLNSRANDFDEDSQSERLIVKIHSTRQHPITDNILEYRLEVNPSQLVHIARSGVKGTRQPDGPDEWAEEEDTEAENAKGKKKDPPAPDSHIRVWMPACMVQKVEADLVLDFEEAQEKKLKKKAGKGIPKASTGRKPPVTRQEDEESASSDDALPKVKQPVRKAAHQAQKPQSITEEEEGSSSSEAGVIPAPQFKATSKQELPSVAPDISTPTIPPRKKIVPIVRDFTKKASNSNSTSTIKDFYRTTKSPPTSLPHKALTTLPKTTDLAPKAAPFPLNFDSDDATIPSSPRSRRKDISSSSETERIKKSPRKARGHDSPRAKKQRERSTSPTPTPRAGTSKSNARAAKIKSKPPSSILEISDSEVKMPATMNSLKPLEVAREKSRKAKAALQPTNVNIKSSDFIDLTLTP